MRINFFVFCFLFFQIIANTKLYSQNSNKKNYVSFVNPFIGTGGHGHTYPGVTLPFGMVQLSPDTRIDDSWDGTSGYHYSDSIIYGFSHTHLSGTGVSDYGDILFMPTTTVYSVDEKKYATQFSHKNETANAGYYQVKLNSGVNVELTSTTRVGLHRYTFPNKQNATVVLNLNHRDKTLNSYLKITGKRTIEGYRQSQGWATDQRIYFAAEFSDDFNYEVFLNDTTTKHQLQNINLYNGNNIKALFSFTKKLKPILLKVAISFVSTEGAKKNLQAEMPFFNFEQTKLTAQTKWNNELKKIEITSDDVNKKTIFYTALYHTMIQPNIAMDVDSMYYGMDKKMHKARGFSYYTVFSLWDTFRAAHPLYTIIDKKRTNDFIKTFLAQYQQSGKLPVWELASNETNCMIGYHATSVIADAYNKNLVDADINVADLLTAMTNASNTNHNISQIQQQFISVDDDAESVSKTLEYAYDDYCIAQFAKQIKAPLITQAKYTNQSQNWQNVFDNSTGFMRPKKNANFLSPFNATEVNNYYTEANSWQYSFFVPHNINGLVNAMGGCNSFNKKLDELFTTQQKTTGRVQDDITGLIGQYAHGNEPSHHVAYLYNYIGQAFKTQQRVNQICNQFYKNSPDGLIGNEDCGQMSAWYVLSALGIYQVCPGNNSLALTSPQFTKAIIYSDNNHKTTINTSNFSNINYIKKIKINDSVLSSTFINWTTLFNNNSKKNNQLNFELSQAPDTIFNKQTINQFYDSSNTFFCVTPIIKTNANVFDDSVLVEIQSPNNSAIFYANLNHQYKKYTAPFYITNTNTISAYCQSSVAKSGVVISQINKRPNNWSISYNCTYNNQYSAGGNLGLIDGLSGTTNWRKGEWQGYQSQNFECTINLKEIKKISNISSNYLQDTRSWILFPIKVEYYTSLDGITFLPFGVVKNTIDPADNSLQIKEFSQQSETNKAQYIKVKATNFGKLPNWHQGFGGDAFIFIDEINIK